MKNEPKTKVCNCCGKRKYRNHFYAIKYPPFIKAICKKCSYKESRRFIEKNEERYKKYRREYFQKNKAKILARQRERAPQLLAYWRKRNKLKTSIAGLTIKEYHKQWRLKNLEDRRASEKIWARLSRKNHKERHRKYRKQLRKRPDQIVLTAHRMRLWALVKRLSKGDYKCSADFLGAPVMEVVNHIESLFRDGMSWENYGRWHIDHKRPCASFDLTDANDQRLCFHYTNLQPLWARDNLIKRASYSA